MPGVGREYFEGLRIHAGQSGAFPEAVEGRPDLLLWVRLFFLQRHDILRAAAVVDILVRSHC